jgi:hypothetical protein
LLGLVVAAAVFTPLAQADLQPQAEVTAAGLHLMVQTLAQTLVVAAVVPETMPASGAQAATEVLVWSLFLFPRPTQPRFPVA